AGRPIILHQPEDKIDHLRRRLVLEVLGPALSDFAESERVVEPPARDRDVEIVRQLGHQLSTCVGGQADPRLAPAFLSLPYRRPEEVTERLGELIESVGDARLTLA